MTTIDKDKLQLWLESEINQITSNPKHLNTYSDEQWGQLHALNCSAGKTNLFRGGLMQKALKHISVEDLNRRVRIGKGESAVYGVLVSFTASRTGYQNPASFIEVTLGGDPWADKRVFTYSAVAVDYEVIG